MTGSRGFDDIQAVLFDLDGTLVDSVAQIVEALLTTLKTYGYEFQPQEIRDSLGAPFLELIPRLTGASRAETDGMLHEYQRIYTELHIPNTKPLPYATALLDSLSSSGRRLAIITSKPEKLGQAVVDAVNWTGYFSVVVGVDTAARPKPAPDPALHALRVLGVEPQNAVLVGDTEQDMGCGLSSGMRATIGVTGTRNAQILWTSGASHVCDNLGEVQRLLMESGL